MNTQNVSLVRIGSTALVALVLLALAIFPSITRAADIGDFGGDSFDYSYPADYGNSYDYSYPADNNGYSYDYSYPADYQNSYDYSYPADSGYDSNGYSSNGYSTGGYSTGGYTTGGYMSFPYYTSNYSYLPSHNSTPSNSNSNTNINTNTCTAQNTCNTIIDDHSVFNAPTIVTVTDYSNKSDKKSNDYNKNYDNHNSYRPPVVAYNPAPYVSLSAAPYTGLELGPVGTVVYWGFLILWALFAAYLIVVKRVQNKIFRSLNGFLFGDEHEPGQVAFAGTPSAAPMVRYSATDSKQDASDNFIFNQINRSRSN